MAFCSQCGADMGGANFCPSCGTASNEVAVQSRMPVGADVRQRSLADMEHMVEYFGVKKPQYDEFDKVSDEIAKRSEKSFAGWIIAAVAMVLIGIFAKAFFFYILAAGFVALFILQMKKNKDKLAAAKARQDALGNELAEYYNDYGYCAVGMEYTKPATLMAIYDLIRKGRASTPGDAINIYLADLEQAEMHRLQAEATAAAKETAENSRQAAKSARKAASYSSASFWFK